MFNLRLPFRGLRFPSSRNNFETKQMQKSLNTANDAAKEIAKNCGSDLDVAFLMCKEKALELSNPRISAVMIYIKVRNILKGQQ